MRKIILDGEKMILPTQTHQYIKGFLPEAQYYGEDLNALYDVLVNFTDDIEITIINSLMASENMPEYAISLFCVLNDAALDNPAVKLELL